MNLSEAFERAADLLGLDKQALNEYAAEDEIGGWPVSRPPHVDWPGGSIWAEEGKFLYAITRALQPEMMLECGTKWGCSTTHFLAALKANKSGTLTSVDKGVDPDIGAEGYGSMVPKTLRKKWTLHHPMSAQDFIQSDGSPFDFAYEDTIHQFDETAEILALLKARDTIKVIISHDICHPWVGYDMRSAWSAVFGAQDVDWHAFCIEPSDCGLAVWRRH